MALNITATPFEAMIDGFAKTISRTPITITENPLTGEETLTDGEAADITGAFFHKSDEWLQDKPGLIQNADAILLVKSSVTINKNDKLTYDSKTYRVDDVVTRRLGTVVFYKAANCFLINE